jgi:hypothetical protein
MDWSCPACKGDEEHQLTDAQKKLQESRKEVELIKSRREKQQELHEVKQKYWECQRMLEEAKLEELESLEKQRQEEMEQKKQQKIRLQRQRELEERQKLWQEYLQQ